MESGQDSKVETMPLVQFLGADPSAPIIKSIKLCNEAKEIISKAKIGNIEEKTAANALALKKYQEALAADSSSLEAQKNIAYLNKDMKTLASYKEKNDERSRALQGFPNDELSGELTYRAHQALKVEDAKQALEYLNVVIDKLEIESKNALVIRFYRGQALVLLERFNLAVKDFLAVLNFESSKANWNSAYHFLKEIEKARIKKDEKEYSEIATKLSEDLDPRLYFERAEKRDRVTSRDENIVQDLRLAFLLAQNNKGSFSDAEKRYGAPSKAHNFQSVRIRHT